MSTTYFELEDDVELKGRWFLDGLSDQTGAELDARHFRYGVPVDLGAPLVVSSAREYRMIDTIQPLRVSLSRAGQPLDFTFAAFDLPVVTTRVAMLLARIAGTDIQRIPVLVELNEQNYEIINLTSRIDCIDAERSEIMWWDNNNNIRPDLAGTPQMITKLVIDPTRIGSRHLFRIEGWQMVIIVSSVVKKAFEDARVSGVRFRQV